MAVRKLGFGVLFLATSFPPCVSRAHAQAALLGPGAAYISAGVSDISTSDLADRLITRGYPALGQAARTFGVGAYRILSNDVMLGFEGTALGVASETYGSGEVGLGGGYATLGVGYVIDLSRRVRVYPRLGLGAGGLGVSIESAADTVSFDDILAEPDAGTRDDDTILSIDGAVFDIGAGIELIPARRGTGLLVGLRMGYLHAPFDTKWYAFQGTSKSDVFGGPEASISGLYFRVVIGGAWRR